MTARAALAAVNRAAKTMLAVGAIQSVGVGAWQPPLPPPHAGQQRIFDGAERYTVVNCGRRFGKTVAGQRKLIEPALRGLPTAWFSPDYKALKEVWRDTLRVLRPVIVATDSQQHRIELRGGGVIEFWSLDGDPEACRGRKYARIVVDEAAKARHLEIAWEQAIRATLIDYQGDAWFLSTPRGKGDFYHTLYLRGLPVEMGGMGLEGWASFHAPTSSNPTIPNLAQELETIRRDTPASVYRQEFEAEFIDAGGQFFDEWAEEKSGEEWHVCTPFDIPPHWPKWGGLDYGKAAPFSFGLHTSSEGESRHATDWDVYRIDEEYQAGLLPSQQAERVVACLRRNGVADLKGVTIYADPAMFPPSDPKKRVGEYPVEAFWAAGLRVVPAANSRIPGWHRCMEWLHATREGDTGDRVPRFRVFKGRCANFIRTIPLMIRDEKHPEDMDTTQEDHAADDWRYACMSRPKPSGIEPAAPAPIDYELARRHGLIRDPGKKDFI